MCNVKLRLIENTGSLWFACLMLACSACLLCFACLYSSFGLIFFYIMYMYLCVCARGVSPFSNSIDRVSSSLFYHYNLYFQDIILTGPDSYFFLQKHFFEIKCDFTRKNKFVCDRLFLKQKTKKSFKISIGC